jgi:hypothetical protein
VTRKYWPNVDMVGYSEMVDHFDPINFVELRSLSGFNQLDADG